LGGEGIYPGSYLLGYPVGHFGFAPVTFLLGFPLVQVIEIDFFGVAGLTADAATSTGLTASGFVSATTSLGFSCIIFTLSVGDEKVKLQQDAPVVVAKAEVKASASKKIIIISCSKGKLTRKISGVNPKFPAGFVKK